MKPKRQYNQQPNIITKSTDDMTLIEKRIMYLVINKLDTGFNLPKDSFKNLDFETYSLRPIISVHLDFFSLFYLTLTINIFICVI